MPPKSFIDGLKKLFEEHPDVLLEGMDLLSGHAMGRTEVGTSVDEGPPAKKSRRGNTYVDKILVKMVIIMK